MARQISIVLPEATFKLAEIEASRAGIDVPVLCSTLLADHFFEQQVETVQAPASSSALGFSPAAATPTTEPSFSSNGFRDLSELDVRREFGGYPEKSIKYAEAVVRTLREVPRRLRYKIRPNGRGIIFEPNFIVIEYLLSRRNRGGIALSLGAPVSKFRKTRPDELKRGRTESYSWILVETDEVLQRTIPLIRDTFDFRYFSKEFDGLGDRHRFQVTP